MPSEIHEVFLLDAIEKECISKGSMVSRPLRTKKGIIDLFEYDPINKVSAVYEALTNLPSKDFLEEKLKKYSDFGEVIFALPRSLEQRCRDLKNTFNLRFIDAIETPLDEIKIKEISQLFSIIGNPDRLKILLLLSTEPRSYGMLQLSVGQTSGNFVYHLRMMLKTGLIKTESGRYLITKEGLDVLELISCFFDFPILKTTLEEKEKKSRPLSFKYWTKEDIQFLRDNYENMTINDIAKKMNRTTSSILGKAKVLGLMKRQPRWSEEEKDYLRKYYGEIPTTEIVANLGRNPFTIYVKASELGLTSRRKSKPSDSSRPTTGG